MKTVFITGANRGLGKGFVEYCLNQGYKVFAGTRNPQTFDPELIKNSNLTVVAIDISDDKSIENAYKLISSQTQSIDYLINNAGVNKDTATNNHKELVNELTSLDRDKLLSMFDINTISPIMLLKQFLPLLNINPSFVINISSNRASINDLMTNTAGNYGYRASKAALNMMTWCTLHDLPENIKTFSVAPGSVKTDMNPTGDSLPVEQAEKIINITKTWNDELNGRFLQFDGTLYP